jgi:iron complex transport system substrate-binding protein
MPNRLPTSPRVVSLVPSATVILRHLGVEPVGISHCCDNHDTGAVVVTSTIVPDGLGQAEIDTFVNRATEMGESLYRVNEVLLERLHPDLVVTQGVCEVCAVAPHEAARAATAIPRKVPNVLLVGTRLPDLAADIALVGTAIGVDVGETVARLAARLDAVRTMVAGRPRPRVAFVEWFDPPFLGGHWVPEMIEAAGGVPIGPAAGDPSVRTTWADIAAARPDVILFGFCGYDLVATLDVLTGQPLPTVVPATYALDAENFCALTPKVVRGVEIVAQLLHPDVDVPPVTADECARWAVTPSRSGEVVRP